MIFRMNIDILLKKSSVEVKLMRYFMTLVWSFLLVTMLNYVVSSVLGVHFDFATGAIISVIFTILVLVISAIIPNEPTPEADHH